MKISALVKFIALAAADLHRGVYETVEMAVADATDDAGSAILPGPVVSSTELKRTAAAEAYPVDVLTIALLGAYFAISFGGVRRSGRNGGGTKSTGDTILIRLICSRMDLSCNAYLTRVS